MAAGVEACLACAGLVKKGNRRRRILGVSSSTEGTVLWKEIISPDVEKKEFIL